MEFTSVVIDTYPVPYREEAARKAVFERWLDLAYEARRHPILVPCSLPVVGVFEPLFEPTKSCEQFQWPTRSSAGNSSASDPPSLEVDLVEEISTARTTWSQVYRATVTLPSHSGPVDAVVKLVHEARFDTGKQFEPDYDLQWSEGRFWTAAELMTREVAAYRAMKSLWGREVPCFYGGFIFKHPCGHLVPGVVLEYIRGETLDEAMKKATACSPMGDRWAIPDLVDSQRRGIQLMRAAAIAYHKVTSLGVRHHDVASRNVLVCRDSTASFSSSRVVLLDFGMSFLDSLEEDERDLDWAKMLDVVEPAGLRRGCWRAYLRESKEDAEVGGWLAWVREWEHVDPSVSDLEEKHRRFRLLNRLHGHAVWHQVYNNRHLPRWAEETDWSDVSLCPASESESDSTASQ